jgi:hypothetical protein
MASGLIQSISFKLGYNLLYTLQQQKFVATAIRNDLYDKDAFAHDMWTYANFAEYSTDYFDNYRLVDWCSLGDLSGIMSMRLTSDTFNFVTTYDVYGLNDLTRPYSIKPGRPYDAQRNELYGTLQTAQLESLTLLLNQYRQALGRIAYAYPRVYSPCYAQPGWSEQTGFLWNVKQFLYSSTKVDASEVNAFVTSWVEGLPLT